MTHLTDTVRNEEVLRRTDAERKHRKYQTAYFGRVTRRTNTIIMSAERLIQVA